MRIWLAGRLRRWADALDPPPVAPDPPPVAPDPPPVAPVALVVDRGPLFDRARVLIAAVEPIHLSGEARRHQVYARLIKEFPAERRRDLAFLIEQVLQESA